ncbi:ComEC/Rec2 family competence protein, partial [Candidatus Microgenomates bacterium]|nr:ComEC/Rec2 family competence protein [Candidatus Microgenomates bacterium]
MLIYFLLQSSLFVVLEVFRRRFKAKSIGCIFVIFRRRAFISFCIVLFVVLRFFCLFGREESISRITKSFTLGNTKFTGYVTEEVSEKHGKSTTTIAVLEGLPEYDANILVNYPSYYNLTIGQVCKFEGMLVEPENFLEFDYKEYLKRKNIYLISDNPGFECQNIEEIRKGFFLRNILTDLKYNLIKNVDLVLSEPQSSLLVGILFGQKRLFSNVFDGYVRMAGVSHVVAASGYNVSILVVAIGTAFGFLKSRIKITVSLIAIWCFTLLSGLSSSIIRACIMLTISLLALFYGRGNSIHISLPLTTTIFLLFDPYILYDVGFQLSLSATFGLVYISPILQKITEKLFQKRKFLILEQYVIPTMSCTISTLPVSVSIFQTFSIWSVPANTFILPIIE